VQTEERSPQQFANFSCSFLPEVKIFAAREQLADSVNKPKRESRSGAFKGCILCDLPAGLA